MSSTERGPVLVVDDDFDVRDSIRDVLSDEGLSVVLAENGREALEYLESGGPRPCVILLDWMMPVMDGEEFVRQKAERPAIAPVPVFLLSARGDPPATMVAMGIQRVFRKPLLFEQLRQAIDGVLNR